jgi:hypothetical protein
MYSESPLDDNHLGVDFEVHFQSHKSVHFNKRMCNFLFKLSKVIGLRELHLKSSTKKHTRLLKRTVAIV